MDKLTSEMLLASKSTLSDKDLPLYTVEYQDDGVNFYPIGTLTQGQLDKFMGALESLNERRAQVRTEKWTPLERFVRVQFLKLRNWR